MTRAKYNYKRCAYCHNMVTVKVNGTYARHKINGATCIGTYKVVRQTRKRKRQHEQINTA